MQGTGRDYDAECAQWRESIALAAEGDDLLSPAPRPEDWRWDVQAGALANLGYLAGEVGDFAAARAHFARALELRRREGDGQMVVVALLVLGEAEARGGDGAAGRSHYAEARDLAKGLGQDWLGTLAADMLGDEGQSTPAADGGRFVAVAGRRLFMRSTGAGPSVVFESGLGDTWRGWAAVPAAVARFARTVTYSRAGVFPSAPGPVPRTARLAVDDLRALLAGAGIAPPFVLVGHSYGGHVVRLFASTFPADVAGVVLVSSAHERTHQDTAALPMNAGAARERWHRWARGGNVREHVECDETADQLGAAPPMPAVPTVVLINERQDNTPYWNNWRLEQFLRVARLLPHGEVRYVDDPNHYIQRSRPFAVIDAVRTVVHAAHG